MDKAVFIFQQNNKFAFGFWVADAGNPIKGGYLQTAFNFLSNEPFQKKGMLETLKHLTTLIEIRDTTIDPQNPFAGQLSPDGEQLPLRDLFWFKKLSENKLLKNGIFSTTQYTFNFLKTKFKFRIDYNNHFMEWDIPYKELDYQETLNDIVEWAYLLDKELADCDCIN